MGFKGKRRKVRQPGYQDRLTTAINSLDLPVVGVGRVSVFHDAGCPMLSGGPCRCVPDISIHVGNEDVAIVGPDGSVSGVKHS